MFPLTARFAGLLVGIAVLLGCPAIAQITPDETLGNERSRVTPNVTVRGGNGDRIDGGATRGGNLFHSFSEFNVNTGQRVYFANPDGIQNILTRITGNDVSDILGTLGVDGTANLFLLNPNGIIFGQNSRLDIRGSFVGTTASGARFGDQGQFTATDPGAPALLTISPSALFFNPSTNGSIINRSQTVVGTTPTGVSLLGLEVPTGQSLVLAGGNVRLEGGGINAPGGQVELAGVTAGQVDLLPLENGFRLQILEDVTRSDVRLDNATVNVAADTGGAISIQARNIDIAGDSFLRGGIEANSGSSTSQAGDIRLTATEAVQIEGEGLISGAVRNNAQGTGSNVIIQAGSLAMSEDTEITTAVFGQGNGGDIQIKVQDLASFDGNLLSTNLETTAPGSAGDIQVTAGSLQLLNGAQWLTASSGQGNAGNVVANVNLDFTMSGISLTGLNSGIVSDVQPTGIGNAGNIQITAGSFNLLNGSFLDTTHLGRGNAGNVTLTARDRILIDTNDINNQTGTISTFFNGTGIGQSGDVQIVANSLELTNGARIQTSLFAQGRSGNINITTQGAVRLSDNSIISSSLERGAIGTGGNLSIAAGSLSLLSGGQLQTNLRGSNSTQEGAQGNAGNITLDVQGDVILRGDRAIIGSLSASGAIGNAGQITIKADSLSLDGSAISATGLGQGNSGDLMFQIDGAMTLNDGFITSLASEQSNGRSGDISMNVDSLSMDNSSSISSQTSSQGRAGNVDIRATNDILLRNSSIGPTTNDTGNAGNLIIQARNLSLSEGALLFTTTSNQGNAGSINLQIQNNLSVDGSSISTATAGNGNAGNMTIQAENLFVTGGGSLFSTTFGQGNAGHIDVRLGNRLVVDGLNTSNSRFSDIFSGVTATGSGSGGNLLIRARSASITNGALIRTDTSGQGDAGDIDLRITDRLQVDGASSANPVNSRISSGVFENGTGQAGNIRIRAGDLSVTRGGDISSSTFAQADAGDLDIRVRDRFIIDGVNPTNNRNSLVRSVVGNNAVGQGGDIRIRARTLSITNGGELNSSTFGQGNAGDLDVRVGDRTLIRGSRTLANRQASISSSVGQTGVGNGGRLRLVTPQLDLLNGGEISVASVGQGNAGNIRINADEISIMRTARTRTSLSGIFSNLGTTEFNQASGQSGTIRINTQDLSIQDGGIIASSTFAQGRAGNITVNADRLSISGTNRPGFSSGLYTVATQPSTGRGGNITVNADEIQLDDAAVISAQTFSQGRGGNVTLNTNELTATDGAQVITSTANQGRAGRIRLNAIDVNLEGSDPTYAQRLQQRGRYTTTEGNRGVVTQGDASGLYANTSRDARGRGGDIVANTQSLTIEDSARISVGSRGSGQGGRIQLQSESTLLNGGQIIANTDRTNSGNIDIQSESVILRDRSRISTNAGTAAAPGNGGNININAGTIVALPTENSDITANAFTGNGGEVNITTQGIIGLEASPTNQATSNITASSDEGVQGAVTLNTPTIDPTQGLVELPAIVTDASDQIDRACSNRNPDQSQNQFVVSGRGSLPPSPLEPLAGSEAIDELVQSEDRERGSGSGSAIAPEAPDATAWVEAQGWAIAPDGQVMLVANTPSTSPLAAGIAHPTCQPR